MSACGHVCFDRQTYIENITKCAASALYIAYTTFAVSISCHNAKELTCMLVNSTGQNWLLAHAVMYMYVCNCK